MAQRGVPFPRPGARGSVSKMTRVPPLLLGCVVAFGCVVPDLLDDRPCPCASGWFCDVARSRCVPGAARDAAVTDASVARDAADDARTDAGRDPARRCWRRPDACSWDTAGFRFDEDPASNLGAVFGRMALLSPDACAVYYGLSGAVERRERAAAGAPFGDRIVLTALNQMGTTTQTATITPDGLEILFVTNRVATGEIYRSTRPTLSDGFSIPVRAEDLLTPGVTSIHYDPALSPDGLTFYFAPVIDGFQRLYAAERRVSGTAFEMPQEIDLAPLGLAPTVQAVYRPTVTSSGRVMLFGAVGTGRDLLYTTRAAPGAPWGRAAALPTGLFTTERLSDASVSPDGCEVLVRTETRLVHLVYVEP